MPTIILSIVLLLAMVLPDVADAQEDVCYPGLDCPEDIPNDGPAKLPRPGNPPPRSAPRRIPEPAREQVEPTRELDADVPDADDSDDSDAGMMAQNCADPFGALQRQFLSFALGQRPAASECTLPSTHCCFEDGSSVPMAVAGLPFASQCHAMTQLFGVTVPVHGLTCRR